MIAWLRGNTLARNLVLSALAVVAGSFIYATADDAPFQVDLAVVAGVIWVAIRAAVPALIAFLTSLKK